MKTVLFESLYHLQHDGWSIATRMYARAMKLAGLHVQLYHVWAPRHEDLDEVVRAEIGDMLLPLVGQRRSRDYYVFSSTLGGPSKMRRPLWNLQTMFFAPRGFYTMFERAEIQPEIIAALNAIEGVWVPCSSNAETLKRCGSTNTTYIPVPYFDDDPALKLPPPTGARNFLWIGRWEPRKAPDQLLKAFLCAFKPGEAALKMKIGPVPWDKPYLVPESHLQELLGLPLAQRNGWTSSNVNESVEFVRGKLSPDQILALHAWADVYASASRGEGIDLPAFTAKLAGRRIVTVDSGGPRDFVGEGDILVPTSGVVSAPQYESLWGPGCAYANFDINRLIEGLQKARSSVKSPEAMPVANRAEYVGKRLAQWLEAMGVP